MQKTSQMETIELRETLKRGGPYWDIRELIQEAFDKTGNQEAAAALLGVTPSTLSIWINKHLGGSIGSRVSFQGFAPPQRETEAVQSSADTDPAPASEPAAA